MSRADRVALFISLLAVMLSIWVALGVYEGLAQLEDEYAYLWQARVISHGRIKIPSPPEAGDFFIPFVIDHQGARFGKYPLGWPVVFSFGERLELRWLVNPILGGLAVWLSYRLGKKLIDEKVGLLTAGITALSPLFLTYSGSILSHTWGLVLTLGFVLSWLDLSEDRDTIPGWLPTISAGASLGLLALSRPWTALGVAIPFGIHGIIQIWCGSPIIKKRIIVVGLIATLLAGLHFLWQFALTGDLLMNPYLLWWDYDKVGFGPGHGIGETGHTFQLAWLNTRYSLTLTGNDLFGWGSLTWILPILGLWAQRRERKIWLTASVFLSLVIVYFPFWVSGPRYFYEGIFSLTILSAAGIARLAGWLPAKDEDYQPSSFRKGLVAGFFVILATISAVSYTPDRIKEIKDLYGFRQADLEPFDLADAKALTPALILVRAQDWKDYGVFTHLQDPELTTPFIFAWVSPDEEIAEGISDSFPGRMIYEYDPDSPGLFYKLIP
jgi:hypothetical protein